MTPESQQAALNSKLYEAMRDELPTYGTIPWVELIAAVGAAQGAPWAPGKGYIGHQSAENNMNSLNRIVTYFVERERRATPVDVSHAALAGLSADAEWLRHLGNDLYAKGHLDRHEAEEIGRVADRYLRAHPAGGVDARSCTCHPNEAPVPCQRKFALSECLRAAGIGAGVGENDK